MQGAAHTANAPPSSRPEPRRRAPVSSPGATMRSGTGTKPRNARPSTTRTKPATSVCVWAATEPPTAAAPAPRTTKTTVKPRMNGRLAMRTRRADPALAESSGFDARQCGEVAGDERQHTRGDHRREAREKGDREPRTHQSRRVSNSSSRRSVSGSSASGGSAGGVVLRPGPAPDAECEHERAERDAAEREPPREQVETLVRRCGEDAGAEARHELGADLVGALALVDLPLDEELRCAGLLVHRTDRVSYGTSGT